MDFPRLYVPITHRDTLAKSSSQSNSDEDKQSFCYDPEELAVFQFRETSATPESSLLQTLQGEEVERQWTNSMFKLPYKRRCAFMRSSVRSVIPHFNQ
jgi:hypothetical protein